MLHIILDQFLGPENESGIIFFRKIDQYIDFRSIDASILKKLSNTVMLHIILDQFLGPENESVIIFSKIDTDRSIYPFSIYWFGAAREARFQSTGQGSQY